MFLQDSKSISLFDHFHKDQLELLNSAMEVCLFDIDDFVFEQGQLAEYLYILYSGKATIRYKPYDGPPLTVATIQPGGVFGWSALLGRKVYSSSAIAQEDCKCYRISKNRLANIYNKNPEFGSILLKRLASAVNQHGNKTYEEILALLKKGVDRRK
ncbi:MAG TPA: cyclic nucleotide-binding domain-containing protein [Bellilinea sp.]|nr:cyclic nucleotide-binding domain-containing protein [Bellilinea sp.]